MRRWMTTIGIALVLLMALAVPSAHAASKTLYVGTCKGSSPYATIQSAVDAVAGKGYTIYVCPGTYNESVTLQNKESLTIRNYVVKNQPAPLIDADRNGGFVVTDSKDVEIRGLRFTNVGNGIETRRSPHTTVRNTIITNVEAAGIIFDEHSDNSDAQFNTITNSAAYGIIVYMSSNATIKHNTISSLVNGIDASYADKSNIEANTITNASQDGIILFRTPRATVKKNTTNFVRRGIYVFYSATDTISDNTAKNNTTAGVSVEGDSAGNTIKNNLLQGNGTDAVDVTTGSKTAGTANTWSSNTCDTSNPAGLCSSAATQRQAP